MGILTLGNLLFLMIPLILSGDSTFVGKVAGILGAWFGWNWLGRGISFLPPETRLPKGHQYLAFRVILAKSGLSRS
jgi:hypothetical protein